MSAEVSIGSGDGSRLTPHPLRAAVLGEVHARPFTPLVTPRRMLHFAFDTAGEAAKADRAALAEFCRSRGLDPLRDGAKHHRLTLGGATLRWEQHSEFTTYSWELPAEGETPFHPSAVSLASPMAALPQPGPLLVALDLQIVKERAEPIAFEPLFDRASLAVAENAEGDALFATDFQADPSGFVRILVIDRGLGPERAGKLDGMQQRVGSRAGLRLRRGRPVAEGEKANVFLRHGKWGLRRCVVALSSAKLDLEKVVMPGQGAIV